MWLRSFYRDESYRHTGYRPRFDDSAIIEIFEHEATGFSTPNALALAYLAKAAYLGKQQVETWNRPPDASLRFLEHASHAGFVLTFRSAWP